MTPSKQLKKIPETSGVYYMKNRHGNVIYVGKAVNLKRRVSSYFGKAHDTRIEKMVSEIATIDFKVTSSALEALILESNEIKRLMPAYNVRERDDKSFLYLVFTKEMFPKPEFVRGHELARFGATHFSAVYGPYLSAASIRAALKILRKIFPYSTDSEKQKRPCFYYHLKLCPGVCVGVIEAKEYHKNIRHLEMVFAGKKEGLVKELKRAMKIASKSEHFEDAGKMRNQIFALEHIQDVAVLTREAVFSPSPREGERLVPRSFSEEGEGVGQTIDIFGRIEGYDISNISGAEAVGSMVVFEDGEPAKNEYRKFKIKTVKGINDVAMMKEVLQRRFFRLSRHPERSEGTLAHASQKWPLPDLILVDGGWGQMNVAREVLRENHLDIPLVGIAKGFRRKQDRPIFDSKNVELERIVAQYTQILINVRDEAHRFAVSYHRHRMRRRI